MRISTVEKEGKVLRMDDSDTSQTPKLYRQTRFGNILDESLIESEMDENEAEAVRVVFDRVVFEKLLKRVDNKVTITAQKKIRQEIDDNTHSFILCGVKFDDGRNVIEVPKLRVAAYTDVNHRMSGIRASKAHDKKRMIVNCNPDMPSDLTELYKVMINSVVSQAKRVDLSDDGVCDTNGLKARLTRLKTLWQSKIEESEITAPIYWKREGEAFSTLTSRLNGAVTSVASADHDDDVSQDIHWDEEEELNSDDDQSIDEEPIETDNIVVCCMKPLRQMKPSQDKPTKRQLKTKWKSKKFRFTEGVMHVNKRDYAFKVANVSILE